jgi:hypothetical protein
MGQQEKGKVMTNPADLALMHFLTEDERARQRAVLRARAYHDGAQPVELTDRLRDFLALSGDTPPFVLNVARLVVQAAAERLHVIGFDSDEAPQGPDGIKPVAAWAWELWQRNRMDGVQDEVHTGAIRDSEYFLLVDGDDLNKRARFTPHPRYTDPQEAGGDGYGIKVFYTDDNERGPIAYATKHWTETRFVTERDRLRRVTVRRMNTYWPDRMERYEWEKGEWALIDRRPWRDRTGLPLGVPVIHFRNTDDRCEASDAWPIQDAINKAFVDLVAAEDIAALGILVTLGFFPTTDGQPPQANGSNALLIQPGAFISTARGPADADAKRIPGENLEQLITAIQSKIMWLAGVTSTPPARFQQTGQIARAETLKEQEAPLLAKLMTKQTLFGNAWEDAFYLARRIENRFYMNTLAEDILLITQWAPTATRDEKLEREGLILEQTLGVPRRKLWSKLGYSEWEIAEMEAMKEEETAREIEKQQAMLGPAAAVVAANGRQN